MKISKKLIISTVALSVLSGVAFANNADGFPNKPIKVIIPYTAGGGTDQFLRLMQPELSKELGTQIVIENRPGGSTTIGAKQVMSSPADGYTLLMTTGGTFTLNPYTIKPKPYSPTEAFDYVGTIGETARVLSAGPTGPADFNELVKKAKADPGKINYSTSSTGGESHLAGELLQGALGFSMTMVPFKGVEGSVAVSAGHIDVGIDGESAASGLIRAGKIKPIMVLQQKRSPTLPDAPSLEDYGIKESALTGITLVVASPKGTPREVREKIFAAFEKVLKNKEILEKLPNIRTTPLVLNSAETEKMIAIQTAAYKKIYQNNNWEYID